MKQLLTFITADDMPCQYESDEVVNPEEPVQTIIRRGMGRVTDHKLNPNGSCTLVYERYREYRHMKTTVEYFNGERVLHSTYRELLD